MQRAYYRRSVLTRGNAPESPDPSPKTAVSPGGQGARPAIPSTRDSLQVLSVEALNWLKGSPKIPAYLPDWIDHELRERKAAFQRRARREQRAR